MMMLEDSFSGLDQPFFVSNGKIEILSFTNFTSNVFAFLAIALIAAYPWNLDNYYLFIAYFAGALYWLYEKSFVFRIDTDRNKASVIETSGFFGGEYEKNRYQIAMQNVVIEKKFIKLLPVYLVSIGTDRDNTDKQSPSRIPVFRISRLFFPAKFMARQRACKLSKKLGIPVLEL